jgi:tetratricopeptide (TPR) repeat protein
MNFVRIVMLAPVVAVLALAAASQALAQSSSAGTRKDAPLLCRPLQPDAIDYRARDSTPQIRWYYNDNWAAHTQPALNRISQRDYSRAAIADLNWTLLRWPNHGPALQGLVRYSLEGGQAYDFDPIDCYFKRARDFAPNDISVLMAEGYYRWRTGDKAAAMSQYQEALKLDPGSSDIHYNLGLVYFDQANYPKAVEHAKIAYDAGYPLPGLRRKLERIKQWPASTSQRKPN